MTPQAYESWTIDAHHKRILLRHHKSIIMTYLYISLIDTRQLSKIHILINYDHFHLQMIKLLKQHCKFQFILWQLCGKIIILLYCVLH